MIMTARRIDGMTVKYRFKLVDCAGGEHITQGVLIKDGENIEAVKYKMIREINEQLRKGELVEIDKSIERREVPQFKYCTMQDAIDKWLVVGHKRQRALANANFLLTLVEGYDDVRADVAARYRGVFG